jgi:negative regulator of flagellin synthesis FlgM
MKIGSIENKAPVAPVAGDRKAPTGKAAGSPSAATSANVEISAEASALASANGDGSFDAAKVERVSQAIKDGTYQINHEAIADKLITNAQELLNRTYR